MDKTREKSPRCSRQDGHDKMKNGGFDLGSYRCPACHLNSTELNSTQFARLITRPKSGPNSTKTANPANGHDLEVCWPQWDTDSQGWWKRSEFQLVSSQSTPNNMGLHPERPPMQQGSDRPAPPSSPHVCRGSVSLLCGDPDVFFKISAGASCVSPVVCPILVDGSWVVHTKSTKLPA